MQAGGCKPELAPLPITPDQAKRMASGRLRRSPSIRTVPTELEQNAAHIRSEIVRLLGTYRRLQRSDFSGSLHISDAQCKYALNELRMEGAVRCVGWRYWELC